MPDEPWDSYEREKLWSGWSYPVGRSIVEAALREAGVHLLSLHFRMVAVEDPEVLCADRYGDLHLRPGIPIRSRADLTLHAVPSARRATVNAALTTGDGLRAACAWLAAAEVANPTWRDRSHSWTACLHGTTLRYYEVTRP